MTVVVALGLVIGVLLGLLGGGGSILTVPALVYGAGEPLARAVPASLLVVGISAATALLPRLRGGQIRWRIALVFGAAGMDEPRRMSSARLDLSVQRAQVTLDRCSRSRSSRRRPSGTESARTTCCTPIATLSGSGTLETGSR